MASTASLHFPSKEVIVSYLQTHRFTKDYQIRSKIIDTVADFFADKAKPSTKVYIGVVSSLEGEEIGLPQSAVVEFYLNLTAALKHCANGNTVQAK